MKHIILYALITTSLFSGFFNEEGAKNKAEYIENDRLCKLFTQKVEKYKSTLRKDILAVASLASYEYRAEIFCKKAEEAKKSL
jgi:hypothetical protein